jgi:hypothetical protein
VSWLTDQNVILGEFAVWIRSNTDAWYVSAVIPANGIRYYSVNIAANVPSDSNYQVIVAYRWWRNWATSNGSFTVNPGTNSIELLYKYNKHSFFKPQ